MHTPVANARMYGATAQLRQDWRDVLGWALREACLAWDIIDYPAPAPLSTLWARDDLGAVMMCGLPFGRTRRARGAALIEPGGSPAAGVALLAAPVPSPARYLGRPIYFTDLVVRKDSTLQTLADSFGGVAGFTLPDSYSGCVAFAAHLRGEAAASRTPARAAKVSAASVDPTAPAAGRPYRRTVGDLIHARGVIEALADGRIDIGPLDSWYHDLLVKNEPHFAGQVRTIATTAAAPIPPLVCSPSICESDRNRMREALLRVGEIAELDAQRERLLLAGFVLVEESSYDAMPALADSVSGFMEDMQ